MEPGSGADGAASGGAGIGGPGTVAAALGEKRRRDTAGDEGGPGRVRRGGGRRDGGVTLAELERKADEVRV
jgi:hypothetical protein